MRSVNLCDICGKCEDQVHPECEVATLSFRWGSLCEFCGRIVTSNDQPVELPDTDAVACANCGIGIVGDDHPYRDGEHFCCGECQSMKDGVPI